MVETRNWRHGSTLRSNGNGAMWPIDDKFGHSKYQFDAVFIDQGADKLEDARPYLWRAKYVYINGINNRASAIALRELIDKGTFFPLASNQTFGIGYAILERANDGGRASADVAVSTYPSNADAGDS